MQKLNFIFFGTPDVASDTLEILKKIEFLPMLIVTSPDAKSGRGLHMQTSPAGLFAEENNIPCLKPEKLDAEFANQLKFKKYDLSIIVAYGKIIPENILKIPKLGSINIHYSLLPKYRGASPVESAILNGETETGVAIQQMEFKLDSGNILAMEKVQIGKNETAPALRTRLIKIGGELLVKLLQSPFKDGEKQDESQTTFCKKIKKEDGLINLNDDPIKNYNKFRAYASWPRTFFFQNNKRIIITDADLIPARPDDTCRAGGDSVFVIKKVLPEGRKEIKWEEFLKINTSK